MKRCISLLVVTLAAGLTPASLCAQDTTQSWPGVETTGLPTVYVRDDTGAEVSGRLLSLDTDAIVVLVGEVEQRIEARRVTRIQKRGDSLRNGVQIGALVGAAVGLLAAGISDCPGSGGGRCPGTRFAGFVVSTGVYAAVGAGLDALVVGRTTLYEAPAAAPSLSARMTTGGRVAVNLRLQW